MMRLSFAKLQRCELCVEPPKRDFVGTHHQSAQNTLATYS